MTVLEFSFVRYKGFGLMKKAQNVSDSSVYYSVGL